MKKIIAILILTTILLSSCNLLMQDNGNNTTNISENNVNVPAEILDSSMNLDGTKWNFVNYDATLDFENGGYLMNAGCNGVGGSYEIGEFGAKLNPGMSTMMFCGDEIMKVESELSKFLPTVTKINVLENKLTLVSSEKTVELEKAKNADLVGSKWTLNSILDNNGIVSDRSFENSFIEFSADNKILGKAVCNNIMGEYKLDGNKLNISKIAMTRKMCSPESFEENKITNSLENIYSYEIIRDTLTLKSIDGKFKIIYNLEK